MKIDREAFDRNSATLATLGSNAVAAQVVRQRTQAARDGAFVEAQLVADFGRNQPFFAQTVDFTGQLVRRHTTLTLALDAAI